MALKRFGVSLGEELLGELDKYATDNGFANRSQAIGFLIGKYVTEQKWQCNNVVAGTIIIMYDRDKREIASRMASIQSNYLDVILSTSQYYIDND
ncbi:MAG: nickel-responsive transcriptional regulator NikR, partial [Rikenellaceae bacterium]|nr:nickel-responsive transcriptional regulator NikR [Rikenellaceae bacterium]